MQLLSRLPRPFRSGLPPSRSVPNRDLKKLLFALITVACCTILTSCVRETHAASEPTAAPVQVRTPAVAERAESRSEETSFRFDYGCVLHDSHVLRARNPCSF